MKIKPLLIAAGLAVVITIAGCIHDSDASGGVPRAEFDAFKAEMLVELAERDSRISDLEGQVNARASADSLVALESRVTSIETLSGNVLAVSTSPATGGRFKLNEAVTPIGSLVGYVAVDGRTEVATEYIGTSPTGYLFRIGAAPRDDNRTVLSHSVPLYYPTADCSGEAYVRGGSNGVVTASGAKQGFVFRILSGALNQVSNHPNQVYAIPAGSVSGRVDFLSRRSNTDTCDAEAGSLGSAFPAVPNDPAVTSVPSAPWEGSVGLTKPAG